MTKKNDIAHDAFQLATVIIVGPFYLARKVVRAAVLYVLNEDDVWEE